MRINPSRLGVQLANRGFILISADSFSNSAVYVRPASESSLFERIEVHGSGQSGQTVWADVGVSVIYGPSPTKGLVELMLLEDVAKDTEHGWTVLENDQQAREWENHLSELAPGAVELLAKKKGSDVLLRSTTSRVEAAQFAQRLDAFESIEEAFASLRQKMTEPQERQAERLARWPGVVQIKNGLPIYELAALAMVMFGNEITNKPSPFADVNPLQDQQAMWRIQILVDLLCRPDRPAGPLLIFAQST